MREEMSQPSQGALEKCSTSKARSPMQCAEMVFGNLTNISPTGSPVSHEIKSLGPHRRHQHTSQQSQVITQTCKTTTMDLESA